MGSIRYAADAVADLAALRNYIAQENPGAARRVADRIVKIVTALRSIPGPANRAAWTARVNL